MCADTSTSGDITISTNGKAIDREAIPYFDIVFLIEEVNTDERLTGTQTLSIMVTDINDNPHLAATKNILVYSYEGKRSCRVNGWKCTGEIEVLNVSSREVTSILLDRCLLRSLLDSDPGHLFVIMIKRIKLVLAHLGPYTSLSLVVN